MHSQHFFDLALMHRNRVGFAVHAANGGIEPEPEQNPVLEVEDACADDNKGHGDDGRVSDSESDSSDGTDPEMPPLIDAPDDAPSQEHEVMVRREFIEHYFHQALEGPQGMSVEAWLSRMHTTRNPTAIHFAHFPPPCRSFAFTRNGESGVQVVEEVDRFRFYHFDRQ